MSLADERRTVEIYAPTVQLSIDDPGDSQHPITRDARAREANLEISISGDGVDARLDPDLRGWCRGARGECRGNGCGNGYSTDQEHSTSMHEGTVLGARDEHR